MADFNRYRFSGKEYDPRTGLYYFGYRYYEPNFQRWLNRDPIGERGGLNLYGFVGNNPVNRIDPLGLWGVAFGNNSGSSYFNIGWGNPSLYFSPNSVGDIGVIRPQGETDAMRFATGIGSRDQFYGPADQITQDLQDSPGIQKARSDALDMLRKKDCPTSTGGPLGWSEKGAGWGKVRQDIGNWLFATPGDANLAYIGSYGGYYSIENINPSLGTATLAFHVDNNMGLESGSRSPTTGENWLPNNPLSFGPLSTVHEHFDWTEKISYR